MGKQMTAHFNQNGVEGNSLIKNPPGSNEVILGGGQNVVPENKDKNT